MTNATIAAKYLTAPRNTWDGTEKIPLDVSGADGVGLASTLKTYVNIGIATLGANTFTALQTITQASANAGIIASTGYSLTGSNATNMIDLAGTWNTSGTPTGFKLSIVNTSSPATSRIFQLLSSSTELFGVDIIGRAYLYNGITVNVGSGAVGVNIAQSGSMTLIQDAAFNGLANLSIRGVAASLQVQSQHTVSLFSLTGKYQLGGDDAAAPVASTFSVQSVVAGTSNTAGANLNITGSLSTGNGIAGKIIFNLSQIVAAATAQNASSPVITLSNVAATGIQFNGYGAGAITADASGNLTAVSDERLKDVVGDFEDGLSELESIQPIVYRWKSDSGMETEHEYAGFAAGNVKDAIPLATGMTPDGHLTLQDRALLAACVNAIKQLAREVRH